MELKKEVFVFGMVSVLKTIEHFFPILLRPFLSLEYYRRLFHFFNSEKMQQIDTFVIIGYYFLFLSCLIYSVIKKQTASYVILWLILIGYLVLNYFLSTSSLLFHN